MADAAANRDSRAVLRMPPGPSASDRCRALSCLERLLTRRRRMAEIGLCGQGTSCAWHVDALDRAIVSYLLLAEDLGIREEASRLLVPHDRRERGTGGKPAPAQDTARSSGVA